LTRAADAQNGEAETAAEEGDQRSEEQVKARLRKKVMTKRRVKSPARTSSEITWSGATNKGTTTYP